MKKIFVIVVLTAAFVIAGKLWLDLEIRRPLPLEKTLVLELAPGTGIRTLSASLAEQNLIRHPLISRVAARLYGFDKKLKAGEYQLEPAMNLLDVFEQIAAGKVILHRLTLPEGLTTTQMLALIDNDSYLTGELKTPLEEGSLLPETYTFHKGTDKNKIIAQAQKAMAEQLTRIWQNRAEDLPLNSPAELLILASIVEKETGVGDERAKVASVFINRLKIGMPLQTDPTVIYALTQGREELTRPLLRKDLDIESPYNTYKHKGLPPAPIACPGIKSLEAAAHPAQTPYLYFVANGQGGHNFARTLDEHNRNVQNWKNSLKSK